MDECHKLLTDKVDLVNPKGHQIIRNVYKPLPLGGPPGQVTIEPQLFFNKDLEYLLSCDKERKTALSISKLKAARYLEFGLEELVPYLWVETSVESYQTNLNLEQPNWDASDFLFKEDYTIVNKPRAVIYRDRDDNKKMMRIDEVHKFSNGTLMRIRDKLDFMVKDFRLFKFNKGMETRKSTEDDKRRSEDFIEDHLKMEMEIGEYPVSLTNGGSLQDDVRLCLGDDLKKAQDHNQRQVKDESKDHYPKCTRYQMKNQITTFFCTNKTGLAQGAMSLGRDETLCPGVPELTRQLLQSNGDQMISEIHASEQLQKLTRSGTQFLGRGGKIQINHPRNYHSKKTLTTNNYAPDFLIASLITHQKSRFTLQPQRSLLQKTAQPSALSLAR
ncbi:hypothetical protein Tco_1093338 [Tanacetum coccineum]|uniref:Uncharacterized protein n=1 Tax=Tanacetum coccineum TaxID=301880 RepID=A0ABQ5ICG9_9ASTR